MALNSEQLKSLKIQGFETLLYQLINQILVRITADDQIF
jgi:hypothetical protein